jgi:hypothetical protein
VAASSARSASIPAAAALPFPLLLTSSIMATWCAAAGGSYLGT